MRELVFLLEEESARAMLEGVMPRLFPEPPRWRAIVFEGKQDLEKQLIRRIRGYQNPDAVFLILRDQDSHPDCKKLKEGLAQLCRQALRPGFLVRIACRELESFYIEDLAAVEIGLDCKGLVRQQNNRKFRAPDLLGSPSQELQRLTRNTYQKLAGSRAIGRHLDLNNARSPSFHHLITGIRKLCAS